MVDRQVAEVADVPHLAGHAVAAAGRRRLLRDHQLFGPDRDPHLAALRLAALSGLDGAARLETLHQQVASLALADAALQDRSEEHTSELQSLMRISYAVFCLKKKTNQFCKNQRQ